MALRRLSAARRRTIVVCSLALSILVLVKLSTLASRPAPSFAERLAQETAESFAPLAVVPLATTPADPAHDCFYDPACPAPSLRVSLTAESLNNAPFVCLNDIRLFEKRKLVKGFNVAVINEKSQDLVAMHYFDLEESDALLLAFLGDSTSRDVIVIVSFGDVAAKLSTHSRDLLQWYGSAEIVDLREGYSFVFVGQRGLSRGVAIEKVRERGDRAVMGIFQLSPLNSEGVVNVARCLTFPLGPLNDVQPKMAIAVNRMDSRNVPELSQRLKGRKETVKTGGQLANCGREAPCQNGEITFSFFSGKNKDDFPQICVNGVFVIDKNLNGAGRGLNLVVIEPKSQQIMRVAHFDTYEKETSDLENFLDQLAPGEMIAVVSFDEASSQLSDMAKQMFYELGSSLVRAMKFRASWYFVGQKGIAGYSAFEDLNFPSGSDWAKAIDVRTCVPANLNGRANTPQRMIAQVQRPRNDQRRHFCQKYDGFEHFCDEQMLDVMIESVPLNDTSRRADPIFNIPILIVAGLAMHRLVASLEAMIAQPGLNPQMVLIAYDVNYPQAAELAALFHFKSLPINGSNYNLQLLKAIDRLWDLFPADSVDVALILEEELIVAPNYLHFMAQLLPVYVADESLATVSAWNNNGFLDTSSLPGAVYRVEGSAPGLAFLLKRSVYNTQIRSRFVECCTLEQPGEVRRWRLQGATLIPDISRVKWCEASGEMRGGIERRLCKARREIREDVILDDVRLLSEEQYDKSVTELIKSGVEITVSSFDSCQDAMIAAKILESYFNSTGDFSQRGDVMIQARVRRLLRGAYRDAGKIDELLRTVLQSRIAVQFIPANSQVFHARPSGLADPVEEPFLQEFLFSVDVISL